MELNIVFNRSDWALIPKFTCLVNFSIWKFWALDVWRRPARQFIDTSRLTELVSMCGLAARPPNLCTCL